MDRDIAVAFIGGAAAVLAAAVSAMMERLRARRDQQTLERARRMRQLAAKFGLTDSADVRDNVDLLVSSSLAASGANVSSATMTAEWEVLRGQIESLRQQMINSKNEIIEVQKIDPILEATLKVTVENLLKRVDLLERQGLSKWDVALVVAQILGTLGLLLGLTFGIIKYLHP
jgi:hypothetical protein